MRLLLGAILLAIALANTAAHANVFDDIGDAIRRGARDVGRAIEGGAKDTGRAIERGANDAGHAIGRGGQEAGRAGTRFFRQVETAFCEIGRRPGEPACPGRAGAGASTDAQGRQEFFTYDPSHPDQRQPIGPDRLTLPGDPAAIDAIFGPPMPMQPWEVEAAERMRWSQHPGDRLGLPWVGMTNEVRSPTGTWTPRRAAASWPTAPNPVRGRGGSAPASISPTTPATGCSPPPAGC